MYSYEEVLTFVEQEDVRFIRLAFFDAFGNQKNISIMSEELKRAFTDGISFDASAIAGFGDVAKSDLFLHPDPSTISILPWRPADGRVVRMYCDIRYPDGSIFEKDGRYILKEAVKASLDAGIRINIGVEEEFYLFETDESGRETKTPFDNAGYMSIAPEDKGENIRREICFNLIDMGIYPESSHHEEGPGQNEIDFKYSDPLSAADNTATFKWAVKMLAYRNGLFADFSPKPLKNESGNGMHINISIEADDGKDYMNSFMAGVMNHIPEMTLFLNPTDNSYERLGERKAPKFITWSPENRSQLIRIPATKGSLKRMELRSPDPSANPYISLALIIYAGLDGIKSNMLPPEMVNINLYKDNNSVKGLRLLPQSLMEAHSIAKESNFISKIIPDSYLVAFEDK